MQKSNDGFVSFVQAEASQTGTFVAASECDNSCHDCNVNCEECDNN